MTTQSITSRRNVRMASCVAGTLLGLGVFSAMAADAPSDPRAIYEKERTRCMSGTSGQDQATCLKEAGAAYDANKRGLLTNNPAQQKKDAMDRCNALQGADQRACLDRVKNAPNTYESGSVKGGGMIHESVTVESKPSSAP